MAGGGSLHTLQSMRSPGDIQSSRSLKKLSLNPGSLTKSVAVLPNTMPTKKLKIVLEKPTRQQYIEDQNTVSKLTIQNDLLRNRLKVLSAQMDTII